MAAQLSSLKGEAAGHPHLPLRDPNLYTALRLSLEDAHAAAAVEAGAVEVRRRVRLRRGGRATVVGIGRAGG